MSDKPKVLWVSDLVTPTGFARVSHSILENLRHEFDVVGLGVNYRGDPHPYPYPIYPAGLGGRVFGEDRLVQILNSTKFDILYILNDAWVISVYLAAIKANVTMPLPRIVAYFPVDSANHDPEWYVNFHMIDRAVTYTEYGKSVVNNPWCAPNLKLDIIPHGINQEVFYKKFTNRRDAKKLLVNNPRGLDSFIFLSANRNQPRKRLDITLNAFKLFAEGKNDVLLHMHCGVRDAHIDVAKLSQRLGIDNKLILTNLTSGVQHIPDDKLNDMYNAADVGLNSSMGEGWGLTSIEHAITGAPQIVPDHSACKEVFSDCGLLVPVVTDFTFDNSMTVGKLITPEGMAGKMNQIYTDRDLYRELSDKTLEKFSDPKYSWKTISRTWSDLFKEVLNTNDNSLPSRD
jgi:D-inositol-3-phosphate glycosyltransferase